MATAKAVKIVSGKIQPPKDIQNFTDEQWVGILTTQENKTTQSVLEMCYAWFRMFESCKVIDTSDEATSSTAESFNETRFGDICKSCSISRATASKRVTIGANSSILAPYLETIPSSIEPLVAICRIEDAALEQLLKAGTITPEISREEAKYLKDSVISARSSDKYAGDIQGYIEENPFEVEDKESTKKKTGGKEAADKVKEVAGHKAQEEKAQSGRLKKLDDAVDYITDLILQPASFNAVIEALMGTLEDDDTLNDLEHAVETVKLVSGGYDE